jgi:hypothetical protein
LRLKRSGIEETHVFFERGLPGNRRVGAECDSRGFSGRAQNLSKLCEDGMLVLGKLGSLRTKIHTVLAICVANGGAGFVGIGFLCGNLGTKEILAILEESSTLIHFLLDLRGASASFTQFRSSKLPGLKRGHHASSNIARYAGSIERAKSLTASHTLRKRAGRHLEIACFALLPDDRLGLLLLDYLLDLWIVCSHDRKLGLSACALALRHFSFPLHASFGFLPIQIESLLSEIEFLLPKIQISLKLLTLKLRHEELVDRVEGVTACVDDCH